MTLPFCPTEATLAAEPYEAVTCAAPVPLGRILVVEDDPVEARRLVSALAHLGYESVVAEDGDAALACLQEQGFAAVLLDLVLPGLDGMGMLGAMVRRGMTTPVVAAVTPAGLEGAASAIRSGAKDFVVKPVGALRLKVALANAISLGATDASPSRAPEPARLPETRYTNRRSDAPAGNRAEHEHLPVLETATPPCEHLPLLDHSGHARPLSDLEAEVIRFALRLYGGHMSEVARRLGIGRSTLYRKLEPDNLPSMELSPPLAVAAE